MRRLFIVCGPESAGNRLVAAYLARAGVDIDASTADQRPDRSSTSDAGDAGLIVHHDPKLTRAVEEGIASGRFVSLVVTGREYGALMCSMIDRGHVRDAAAATGRIRAAYIAAGRVADRYDLPMVPVSYESLVLHQAETVENMLTALDLPLDGLDCPIEGQGRQFDPEPIDRNEARYA